MALPSLIGLCAEIAALGLVLSRYFGAPRPPYASGAPAALPSVKAGRAGKLSVS